MSKVAVIGLGYVGQNIAIYAAESGHSVIGIDIDAIKVEDLHNLRSEVPGIDSLRIKNCMKSNSLNFTTEFQSISAADIIIIAVPTPINKDSKPNLDLLKSACVKINPFVSDNSLIINESTSYPGTLRNLLLPLFDNVEKRKLMFASAPERVDPGNINWNIRNTPRIVSGLNMSSTELAFNFYSSICNQVHVVQSPEVAEAAKLLENTFRQVNIALVNEFAQISEKFGISAVATIEAAATKPFGFTPFFPGIGVGGHCIPVDPCYLSYAVEALGGAAKFIDLANSTNSNMPKYIVSRIEKLFNGELNGKKIQIAGIAYKMDVSDLRESPVIDLIIQLRHKNAIVIWCDPLVRNWNGEESIELASDIDLGIIASPHAVINYDNWKKSDVKVLDLSATSTNYGWTKFL